MSFKWTQSGTRPSRVPFQLRTFDAIPSCLSAQWRKCCTVSLRSSLQWRTVMQGPVGCSFWWITLFQPVPVNLAVRQTDHTDEYRTGHSSKRNLISYLWVLLTVVEETERKRRVHASQSLLHIRLSVTGFSTNPRGQMKEGQKDMNCIHYG